MICSTLRLKVLGLCIVGLGMMTIGAGAAQAEPGARWNVNGKALGLGLFVELGASLEGNHGVLLSRALGTTLNVLCTGMKLEQATLQLEGEISGRIEFSGCKILLNGTVSTPCEPHTGVGKGVILTNLLRGEVLLTGSQPFFRVLPAAGSTFVTIETSAECAVGTKIPVIGQFDVSDCQGGAEKEKVSHLGQESAALTEVWILSKTVEHEATIDGSAELSLAGAHSGLTWSGIPA